jgi:hypothetical protein
MCSAVAGEPFIPLFKGRIAPGAAAALAETLSSGQLATGPKVKAFEDKLGQFVGNPHCVATSDRAGALTIALRLCGVTPGDDVADKIEEQKATVKFQMKKVLCLSAAVANVSMPKADIVRNASMSINYMVSLLKKNWQIR